MPVRPPIYAAMMEVPSSNSKPSFKTFPTKRALDAGDSAAFSSSFLALSFLCSQAESMVCYGGRSTQTVGQPICKIQALE